MSNNIYDILKKMAGLEAPKSTLTESKKAKPDYIDIDKDGDKKEPMKKAAKDKAKGGMAEAVARVEQQLSEKYMGFKKTVAAIKKGGSADNPEAVAAAIGRKKYGKEKFQKAATAGKKLGEVVRLKPGAEGSLERERLARQAETDRLKQLPPVNLKRKTIEGKADSDSREAEFKADMDFVKSGGGHVDKSGTAYDRFGNPAFGVDARKKLEKDRTYPVYRYPGVGDGMPDRPVQEDEIEESGLQAYLGKKKYGKEGMQALQKAGREGASKEKMAKIRAQHDKMDEGSSDSDQMSKDSYGQYQKNLKPGKTIGSKIATGAKNIKRKAEKYVANKLGHNLERGPLDEQNYTEDMLSPAQKKFAALAEPKDKITYADKIAGAKKKQKDEGNEFSGELAQARAQGKDSFEVDGKSYPVKEGRTGMREGWEEMQKYLEKKRGPESKGGEGKKAGTRYGGSAQRDDDEETDGEGQAVVKKKGRPKGTGGGAKFSFKKPKD